MIKALFYGVCMFAASAAMGQEAAAPAPVAAPGFMAAAQSIIELISQLMFGLMIIATVLVRTPWLKKNAGALEGLISKILRLMTWMPTLGVDPRTKALESALKDMQAQNKEAAAAEATKAPEMAKDGQPQQ